MRFFIATMHQKKSLFAFIGLLLLLVQPAMGQSLTQSIRGIVTDKDSKVPLPGAFVVLVGSDPINGAQTDIDGRFKIDNVPVGRQTLQISFTGYESTSIPNIVVGSGKEVVANIELQEAVQKVGEVVVKSDRKKNQPVNEYSLVSTRTVSIEQTSRTAGSFTDLTRTLLTMPGVSNGKGDINNEIVIRGNSPRGLLWQVEGIEVPSPNHFNSEGASSGAVTAIADYVLGTSDFSTGAFAPEYGNALSGVFDIRLRKGNFEKHEFTAEASLLGLSFGAEGPFKKGTQASYLTNFRYSTLGIMDKLGIHLVGNANPTFQDLTVKLNLPSKKAGTFTLFVVGGKSDLYKDDKGTLPDGTKGIVTKDDEGSDFLITGLANNYIINEKTWLNTIVAFTASQARKHQQDILFDTTFHDTEKDRFFDYATKASFTLNHKFNSRHDLKSGLIFSYLGYNYYSSVISAKTLALEDRENEKGGTEVIQGFSDWRWRILTNLTMNTGFHLMYFLLNNHISVEPRLSLRWQFNEKQTLSWGFGMHSRRETLITYMADRISNSGEVTKPNQGLDFTKAIHFVMGYDNMLLPSLHLKAEAYYQYLYEVPVRPGRSSYSSLNYPTVLSNNTLINSGSGINYGIEITLEKFFNKGYYFTVNTSLYESKYKPSDGIERNTRYNGNYIVNALGGQEFKVGKKRNNTIGYGLRATLAGGKRYTPLNTAATIAKSSAVYDDVHAYSEQTPMYYRFDAFVSYTTNFKRCSVTYRFDAQNFTNHHNVYNVTYSYRNERLEYNYEGQILPVLDVKIEF